ncbi:hypothetical protein HFO56_25010 [Rhizobium laguerreae]|uniref:hypothetical protein n=1 Tax=Rhizobium laguerreae TaxID=1076926 RepID=UPI001C91B3A6|nr:hypothetical protein [Rhizobium laguerreae]MBY3155591.1 hypothetical protein [Rhizobium laguerreae]
MTTDMYPNCATYLMTCNDDPRVRKALVSRIAERFRAALAGRLSQSQLIGVDYANTYGPVFGRQLNCASHDYCDANLVFWPAMAEAMSERTDANGGHHPLHKPGHDLLDIIVSQENELGRVGAEIWNEAWAAAALNGFSSLWSVKDGVPAESTFKVLAEVSMTLPPHVAPDDPRYPGLPMITDAEDEIRAAAQVFLDHATPLSVADALEAATIVHQFADQDDADGIIGYFASYGPAPQRPLPRP